MQKAKLSKRIIEAIPVPVFGSAILWDSVIRGLGVRILSSGIRSYVLDYRLGRRRRRLVLGRFDELCLDAIRRRAKQMLGEVASGIDPFRERGQTRGRPTFADLAHEYIQRRCDRAVKRSGHEDERVIRKELLPRWGPKVAADIGRRDVVELLDAIMDRGARVMANRTRSIVSRIFNFGIDRALVETNPALRVKPGWKESGRSRILNAEEIRKFWVVLDGIEAAAALRMILLTAQRPGEVSSMQWEELDDDGVWTIPPEKSKNKGLHRVPLSAFGLELLDELGREKAGPVFPSPIDPTRSIRRDALARALNRNRAALDMPPFTAHDLRRTAASQMTRLGIPRTVVGKILNHADRDMIGIYDRYAYDQEKLEALEKWGERLRDIIAGRTKAKIVPFGS
jgi:integrase